MRRVLITGGGGFLGSHVAAALAQRDDVEIVVAADLRSAKSQAGVVPAILDVTESTAIAPLLREHRIDTVVHLAAIVNPGRNVDQEYRVDVTGSANVLAACAQEGVRRIVVSSSGAAYGYHPDNPDWIGEDQPLRGNDSFPYARHKRLVEEMLSRYRHEHPELEQVIFRIGTILGPTVQNQITALWDAKRILCLAGSESPFVFIWVDDVAAAMVRAATDGPPGIFNVAGDGRMTTTEIAARLGKRRLILPAWTLAAALRVGQTLRLTPHGPEKVPFLRYRPVLANQKLKDEFGYRPQRTTSEAFEDYLLTHSDVARRRHAAE
ncbi:SDR family oxidoreductase [Microbacterium sp. NPDC076768]|uniref:SDR family oxidoreductase n=1 Tax=Microbacterium sp. NPDC076768 TaxID=3154858 RepID=UPI0034481521